MIVTRDLIGKPYKHGARGPDEYDCWGLLMELYRRQGIEIPDLQTPEAWKEIAEIAKREVVHWREIEPREGAAILMGIAHAPHHVGMYLGMGRFIHTHQSVGGVCIEQLEHWKRRVVGFYEFAGVGGK